MASDPSSTRRWGKPSPRAEVPALTAVFLSPICAAKVTAASWAIVLTLCKKEIKTSLFGGHEQQRNKKNPKKGFYSSCSEA